MITINGLAEMIMDIAGIILTIKHIEGPLGVRGRNTDNGLIYERLNWMPTGKIRDGREIAYMWIEEQARRCRSS
jgi:hypothetical protein